MYAPFRQCPCDQLYRSPCMNLNLWEWSPWRIRKNSHEIAVTMHWWYTVALISGDCNGHSNCCCWKPWMQAHCGSQRQLNHHERFPRWQWVPHTTTVRNGRNEPSQHRIFCSWRLSKLFAGQCQVILRFSPFLETVYSFFVVYTILLLKVT